MNNIWVDENGNEEVLTDEEVRIRLDAEHERILGEQIRQERNILLAETDYAVLSDTAEVSEEMLAYRQALRDVTSQETFPDEVVWPTKP